VTAPQLAHRRLDHVVLIVAAPGAGKTFLLQKLEKRHRERGARFVVHDRLGHWLDAPGRVRVRGEPEEAARVAIREAPCTLIIDEASDAFPSSGWSPKLYPALQEVLRVGRQASADGPWRRAGPVSLLLTSQRPAEIHTCVRGMIDRLYVGGFPSTAVPDLEWIAKALRDPTIIEKAPALPFGKFLPYWPRGSS